MPDGHGVRCFRVEIDCAGGTTLRPIIAATNEKAAREKAAVLAEELCRTRLLRGGSEDQRPMPYVIGDAIRVHRWWTE